MKSTGVPPFQHPTIAAVAAEYGVTYEEITGRQRWEPLVSARQMAMFIMRHHQKLCYMAIANTIRRSMHHGAVMHGVTQVQRDLRDGCRDAPRHYGNVCRLLGYSIVSCESEGDSSYARPRAAGPSTAARIFPQ